MKELTTNQTLLIQHLIAGLTQEEAAQQLGISRKTVQRWLDLPHVAAAYAEIQQNVTLRVRKQIESLSSQAIEALKESLDSPSHLAKIQAIKIVLDRLDPETLKVAQTVQPEPSMIEPDLLSYLEDHEIKTIDEILERARARKQEAEEKITPLRKQA